MDVTWSELNNARLLSPKLWKGFARPTFGRVSADQSGNPAIGMFDDFTDFGGALSTNDGNYWSEGNHYTSYQTASTFIVPVALTPTPASVAPTSVGAIALYGVSGVTDNDIQTLCWGGQLAAPYGSFPFNVIPKMSGDLVFECRIKTSSIAASIGDVFVGLAGEAGVNVPTAVLPILDADTMGATYSSIGFARLSTNTSNVRFVYNRNGGTMGDIAAVATLVADTYIKLGFRWDSRTQIVTPYIDGEPVAAAKRTTKAIAAATPWPTGYMAPVICNKQIDGTTLSTTTMDWWACAQYL